MHIIEILHLRLRDLTVINFVFHLFRLFLTIYVYEMTRVVSFFKSLVANNGSTFIRNVETRHKISQTTAKYIWIFTL